MASSSTFTPILTATPGAPPTYNVGMAETFSWIPVEGAGRPIFARASYIANPEDIKISLSAENINVSLDELELNTDNIEELIETTNGILTAFKLETDVNIERTNTLLEYLTATQNESVSLLHALTANTDDLEELVIENNTLLNSLTALTQSEFDETQTLLTNEFNETQTLLNSLTALTQGEFNETQTLLNSLTSLQNDKQSQIITLLHQLTANTDELEINTDGVETLLNSLTALTESEFNDTQTLLTNEFHSLTALTQSEFNETQTLLDSLTALQDDKQSQIITLLHQLTANTDELEVNTDGVETLLNSLTALTQSEFDETQTLLNSLTALQEDNQSQIITLLHQLTANTDEIEINLDNLEINTDGVEFLLSGTNSLLNTLTAVDYATATKQDSIITLLHQLTANTDELEINTDEVETLLDSLTALTQSEFDETQTLLTNKFDSLTSITQSEFDETQTLLNALTALQEDKQNQVITLLHQLTANTDSLEVNTDEAEFLLSGTNVLLNSLTAVDYSTATKQDSIITLLDALTAKETTISLDVSAINLNTDEIEGLIEQTNTLLDALTAKTTTTDVSNIETKLDVLTAVDYATSAKQDTSNSLLDSLTAIQVDKQDQIITLLHSITGSAIEVDLNTDQLEIHVDDVETLLHDLTASNKYVPGFSIPPYDEISFSYVGTTDIFRTVTYLNNTTQVMSLSFTYITEPPTVGDAIIQSVKKI
jgi:uncharacterized protein YrzB (UPF0473 family)